MTRRYKFWGKMLRTVVAHCNRVLAAQGVQSWRQQISANQTRCYFLIDSTAPYSSSSSSSSSVKSSLHNYCMRKRRKWPNRPYQKQLLENFACQLAKRSFKQSTRKSNTHLLPDLINAFAAYEIDPTPESYHFLFKILIQMRPLNCREQISQALNHIEKVESLVAPECIFVDLVKFYGDNNMFDEAVELFLRTPRFRCVPSVEVLNALLSVLCKNEKGLEIVPPVLVNSQAMNIRIEESSFEILIRALCKIGRANNAMELLKHIAEEGFDVDQKVCSLMLATMCRQLDCSGDEIMGFLDELKMLGFKPRMHDFFNAIRFLVGKGNSIGALELLKQMKMNGSKPDIKCYNLILHGLIHNRDFSNADKMFDELLLLGLIPDIYTYNAYIDGLCMQGKVEDGIEIMGSMEDLGCVPDLNTYNTVLKALYEEGKLDGARELVSKMQQKCLQLNRHSYVIMIDGFVSNGDVGGAYILLNEMLDKSFVPDSATLDKLICLMSENGLYFEAVKLLEKAVTKEITPGSSTWKALIQGLDPTFSSGWIVDFARCKL